ncbi:MAG TPA: hypothetical protein DEH25_08025, partial [Chloroflexi bacterium]|nr:hypothetical protein [Chloroflexota bacterium]
YNFLDISEGDTLTVVGSGRDWDHLGEGHDILTYAWYDDTDTLLCEDVCGSSITVAAADLGAGKHEIYFSVQDNEGNWSKEVSLDVHVYEVLHQIFMPLSAPVP